LKKKSELKEVIHMVVMLVVLMTSVFGVSAPEMGTPCDDALAALRGQGLQIVSSDRSDMGTVFTLIRPFSLNRKVAIIECGLEELPPER
jgi:hypothetical protein